MSTNQPPKKTSEYKPSGGPTKKGRGIGGHTATTKPSSPAPSTAKTPVQSTAPSKTKKYASFNFHHTEVPPLTSENYKDESNADTFDAELLKAEFLTISNYEIIQDIEEALKLRREATAESILEFSGLNIKSENLAHEAQKFSKYLESLDTFEEKAMDNWERVHKESKRYEREWRLRLLEVLRNDKKAKELKDKVRDGNWKNLEDTLQLINVDDKGLYKKITDFDLVDKDDIQSVDPDSKQFNMLLGSGTFGKVYKAFVYGNLVAVKELKLALTEKDFEPGWARLPNAQEMSSVPNKPTEGTKKIADVKIMEGYQALKKECRILSTFDHANIVRYMGACFNEDPPFYALITEVAHNGSLSDVLYGKNLQLSPGRKMAIIGEIVDGMNALHNRYNILHLDIKPSNILLDENFHAKIADFGLAHLNTKDQWYFKASIGGTPVYMAPELVPDKSRPFESIRLSDKVDVYSFGVLLYELMTEQKPSQSKEDFKNLNSKANSFGAEILLITTKSCLSENPNDRPSFKQMYDSKPRFWESARNFIEGGTKTLFSEILEMMEYINDMDFKYFIEQLQSKGWNCVDLNNDNPVITAFLHFFEIGNINEKVLKVKIERLNTWFSELREKFADFPIAIESLFKEEWFWGVYDEKRARNAFSQAKKDENPKFLVGFDNYLNWYIAWTENKEVKFETLEVSVTDEKEKKKIGKDKKPLDVITMIGDVVKKRKTKNMIPVEGRPKNVTSISTSAKDRKKHYIHGNRTGDYDTTTKLKTDTLQVHTNPYRDYIL